MSNVIKIVLPTPVDSYAEKALTLTPPFYVSYRWAVTAATLANLDAVMGATQPATPYPVNFTNRSGDGIQGIDFGPASIWKWLGDYDPAWGAGAAAGTLVGDTWNTVDIFYDGTTIFWTINGGFLTSYALASGNAGSPIRVGASWVANGDDQTYYIADLKVGTTLGGTDIFNPDLSGGTFAAFDSTTNPSNLSIVADPAFPSSASSTHGVLIAFDDPVLTASPTYTDLGSLDGVSIQQVEINRGRPTERDTTQIGTATITGVCTTGILDPTYAAGTYFGKLDPMKHVKIELQDPTTSAWSPVFRGYVSDWTYDFDISENVYTFTIDCEDALSIISDAEVVPDQAGNTVPAESTGDVYYDPTSDTGDRVLAAIADTATTVNPYGADWPSGLLSVFTGNDKVKGTVYSPRTPLLQVIDDASNADLPYGNNRWVKRDGTFAFHGRLSRFDPTNPDYDITFWNVGDTLALAGDSTTAVISGLKVTRGKTNLLNAALVTPKDIADADIAGQFSSDATSITAYGARSVSFESLLTDGSSPGASWGPTTDLQETKLMADGIVANYKDPKTRISEVTFRPQGTTGNRAARVWAVMTTVELNDVFTVTTSHPGGGGFTADDQFVESVHYSWDVLGGHQFTNVTLRVELSPRSHWTTNPFT